MNSKTPLLDTSEFFFDATFAEPRKGGEHRPYQMWARHEIEFVNEAGSIPIGEAADDANVTLISPHRKNRK